MALVFQPGFSNYLATTGIPAGLADFPFSLAVWFNTIDEDTRYAAFGLYDEGVAAIRASIELRGDLAFDPIRARYEPSGGDSDAIDFRDSKWHQALGTYTASTITSYLDGLVGTPVTGLSMTFQAFDTVVFGADRDNSPGSYMEGSLAEGAIWNIALDANAAALLATGIDARFIHPEALVYYCKLLGRSFPEPDLIGGLSAFPFRIGGSGPLNIVNPRIYVPRNKLLAPAPAVAAPTIAGAQYSGSLISVPRRTPNRLVAH